MQTAMLNFMTKYFNKLSLPGTCKALVLTLLSSVVFFSCVKVDDSLGTDFIPNDQQMAIQRDSTFQIKTYNVTATDSVMSSGMTVNFLGSYLDPMTGSVNASLVYQMAAPYFKNDSLFGEAAVIDSLFIRFGLPHAIGKKDVAQTFEIYELTELVHWDSTYYSDFDASKIIKKTPRFTLSSTPNQDYMTVQVQDQQFIKELLDTTGYSTDSIFKKRFKGFYIKPVQAHKDAAVYSVNMTDSYMVAYYHNKSMKKDSVAAVNYPFSPNIPSSYYYTLNQCINVIDHDFSKADPSLRLNDKTQPVAKTYIQGYAGVQTYLEFTEESVNALKEKVRQAGYKDIAINKAKLEIFYPARTPELLDEAYTRLGMFFDYKTMEAIPDFSYGLEMNGYYISYGGYINRSRYLYEMDITYYVQRLFREDYDKRGIVLAPSVGNVNETYKLDKMELNGYGSESPLRLVLTYTMIR